MRAEERTAEDHVSAEACLRLPLCHLGPASSLQGFGRGNAGPFSKSCPAVTRGIAPTLVGGWESSPNLWPPGSFRTDCDYESQPSYLPSRSPPRRVFLATPLHSAPRTQEGASGHWAALRTRICSVLAAVRCQQMPAITPPPFCNRGANGRGRLGVGQP